MNDAGRWPANVALDEDAAALLDSEFETGGDGHWPAMRGEGGYSGGWHGEDGLAERSDDTTAAHRDSSTPPKHRAPSARPGYAAPRSAAQTDAITESDHPIRLRTTTRRNHHRRSRTPIDLMRWLCRLVVPAGGHVPDPFAGSRLHAHSSPPRRHDCLRLWERDPEWRRHRTRSHRPVHCAQCRHEAEQLSQVMQRMLDRKLLRHETEKQPICHHRDCRTVGKSSHRPTAATSRKRLDGRIDSPLGEKAHVSVMRSGEIVTGYAISRNACGATANETPCQEFRCGQDWGGPGADTVPRIAPIAGSHDR